MPHTDKNQPEFNQQPDSNQRQQSQSLSREIDSLQSSMRIDFDQKLGELAGLLARFKAMVAAPDSNAANDDAVPAAGGVEIADVTPECSKAPDQADQAPVKHTGGVAKITSINDSTSPTKDEPVDEPVQKKPASLFTPEPARFESGLYKLNCQLYRFRLELDQEMEFREEPLHVHFRQESELSMILQKISDKSSEKNPDSH